MKMTVMQDLCTEGKQSNDSQRPLVHLIFVFKDLNKSCITKIDKERLSLHT